MSVIVQTQNGTRKTRGYLISEFVHKEVKHLAVDVNTDTSELVELAIRLLLAIANAKYIPRDLAELLARTDPIALDALKTMIERLSS